MAPLPTVLVFADQLNVEFAHLRGREPGSCRILLVESRAKLASRPWHRQRVHLYLSALRHFAAELTAAGHLVDHRQAPDFASGLAAHRAEFDSERVLAMEPNSLAADRFCRRSGVELVPSDQFLCHRDQFGAWAADRSDLRMEDFYRWQRRRLGVLVEGGDPVGGRWNLDHENRLPPPRDGRDWPRLTPFDEDSIDAEVLAWMDRELGPLPGARPRGWWPVTRGQALIRLDEFVTTGLAPFGPYEDAMLAAEWKMAHSCLSSAMNMGLLHPGEVVAAVVERIDEVPLSSVEGFVRQVIGWREYVWGLYWLWMPEYGELNELGAERPLPAAWHDGSPTGMACLDSVLAKVEHHGWAHHIERLMVLGNLALTLGVQPAEVTGWMWERFVDGAEWVMMPNVVGMALHADGGRMATKPYAAGGAYIKRMSDHCPRCPYDPKRRTGDTACPYTSLYWDFLARHETALSTNHRMGRQLGGMRRLADLAETRVRADHVARSLERGQRP